jgi:hypothetical protein
VEVAEEMLFLEIEPQVAVEQVDIVHLFQVEQQLH